VLDHTKRAKLLVKAAEAAGAAEAGDFHAGAAELASMLGAFGDVTHRAQSGQAVSNIWPKAWAFAGSSCMEMPGYVSRHSQSRTSQRARAHSRAFSLVGVFTKREYAGQAKPCQCSSADVWPIFTCCNAMMRIPVSGAYVAISHDNGNQIDKTPRKGSTVDG
jgi:hypothetical protein